MENSKDANYKLAVQIESIYGTSIWVHHAGTRAKYPKLTSAASNVFSSLFHINHNPNYSKIVLYDKHLIETSKEKVPEVFENLIKNEGVNSSNLPFSSQPHDAVHEEYNKKGVNVFRGEDVSDFSQAFSIVDDVYELPSKMFDYSDVTDRMDTPQAKVPDYEPLVKQIRTGIRKSQYYMTPNKDKELCSMTGAALNPQLSNIYRSGVSARDSDIRNVIRYNDINKGYSNKNCIPVLNSEKENPKSDDIIIKNLQTEIKIMIEIIDNADIQLHMRKHFKENKNKGKMFLEEMLDGLSSNNYSFM